MQNEENISMSNMSPICSSMSLEEFNILEKYGTQLMFVENPSEGTARFVKLIGNAVGFIDPDDTLLNLEYFDEVDSVLLYLDEYITIKKIYTSLQDLSRIQELSPQVKEICRVCSTISNKLDLRSGA